MQPKESLLGKNFENRLQGIKDTVLASTISLHLFVYQFTINKIPHAYD